MKYPEPNRSRYRQPRDAREQVRFRITTAPGGERITGVRFDVIGSPQALAAAAAVTERVLRRDLSQIGELDWQQECSPGQEAPTVAREALMRCVSALRCACRAHRDATTEGEAHRRRS